jgi:hypothetical protein
MPVAHLQIKYKASAARMSEATSGFRCASDPACRCAYAGYAFAGHDADGNIAIFDQTILPGSAYWDWDQKSEK